MNGRWWEYYAVRYLVGSIVGAVIIFYLATDSYSPFKIPDEDAFEVLKESKFLGVTVLAALGFAFCYIASSPILIFHACRAHLCLSTFCKQQRQPTCITFAIAILATISIVALVVIIICIAYFLSVAWIPMTVIVILQIVLLGLAFINQFKTIETFYTDLAEARANNAKSEVTKKAKKIKTIKTTEVTETTEYVTSYRHLREHGNAFAIIILEVVLAYTLVKLSSIINPWVIIVIWIFPGAFAWIIGTVLELKLVDRSRH